MQNEEVAAIHVRDMINAASVITLHTAYKQPHAQTQGRSGKQRNSHYLEKEKQKPQDVYECGTCGYRHAEQECPAKGLTYIKCKKVGHFRKIKNIAVKIKYIA